MENAEAKKRWWDRAEELGLLFGTMEEKAKWIHGALTAEADTLARLGIAEKVRDQMIHERNAKERDLEIALEQRDDMAAQIKAVREACRDYASADIRADDAIGKIYDILRETKNPDD